MKTLNVTSESKYLKLYYEWMESERIPTNGLCSYFGTTDELFSLIDPDRGECLIYWGHEEEFLVSMDRTWHEFTPLRQNVVLLMAAMNGEL
jgi:hypothetical protein